MSLPLEATVLGGRLVVDEPTDLPDGTVLNLVLDDEGDGLGDADRKALEAAISRSLEQAAAGESRAADVVLTELRARRGG